MALIDLRQIKGGTTLQTDVTQLKEFKGTAEGQISGLQGSVTQHGEEIEALKAKDTALEGQISDIRDAVVNKNGNTIVVDTVEEIATENADPKVGDMAYVVNVKRVFIYKGVSLPALLQEYPGLPEGWIVLDEITSEVDLAGYLKKEEAETTYRKTATKITEGDLGDGIKNKINGAATDANLQAEIQRAKGEEGKLAARLTTIEGEGPGSIKKALQDAKGYADQKVTEEKNRATQAETALGERIDGLQGKVEGVASAKEYLFEADATNNQLAVTLPKTPVEGGIINLFINGIRYKCSNEGKEVTFVDLGFEVGEGFKIQVIYKSTEADLGPTL